MKRKTVALVLFANACLALWACPAGQQQESVCQADSDAELCSGLGYNCGSATVVDNCGVQRRVSCGECSGVEVCGGGSTANVCGNNGQCFAESDAAICTRLQKNCDPITTTDNCMQSRSVDCGVCSGDDTCGGSGVANVCGHDAQCQAESVSAICTRLGKNCDAVTTTDNCQQTRTVSCGTCTDLDSCGGGGVDNVCGHVDVPVPETDVEMCTRLEVECGYIVSTDSDGIARTPHCGRCTEPAMCGGDGVANACGSAYPYRDVWNMKGIQPDNWSRDNLQAHGIKGVPANMLWAFWEPQVDTAPCSSSQVQYDNRCYSISSNDDAYIRDWSNRGALVTGILFGVPAWASRNRRPYCGPDAWNNGWFWAPDDDKVADFARFAAMLADRYDGTKGHGKVSDFVVLNEVNAQVWFDAGRSHPNFSQQMWIDTYADNYIAAYDAIKREQAHAKVLMSFTHHYDERHDLPFDPNLARLSSKSMIRGVAARAGEREWRVAFHPYPRAPLPYFDARDLYRDGITTYGSVGAMIGWLRAEFPDHPHAWEVQLTENGVASGPNTPMDSNDNVAARLEAQRLKVCEALRNVVGTPWIDNHIYHRMVDHSMEANFLVGLAWGLNNPKPAWATYANASLPGTLDCGFEDLPYTRLRQGKVRSGLGDLGWAYWTSSRVLPDDYELDANSGWRLLRAFEPGTQMLFECATGEDTTLISKDPSCEGMVAMGPVGYAWSEAPSGAVPLYRCRHQDMFITTHFVSTDPACGSDMMEEFLGYALPGDDA